MCYICKLRLKRLLEKGYIFDAQVAEVTAEVKEEFDKDMIKVCEDMTDIESSAVIATLIHGISHNPEDYLKTTRKPMTNFGMTDDLLDQILKNYDPKKAN